MNEMVKHFLIDPDYSWISLVLKIFSVVLLFLILSLVSAYCENTNMFSLIISGGINYGSIVKSGNIDAITSASKVGGHGSIHNEINIYGHFIETGLDYISYFEDINYKDTNKNIDGTRSFSMHSINLPIMYNFHFFNRKNGNPTLILGLGLLGYYFPYQEIRDTGTLSGYNKAGELGTLDFGNNLKMKL